MSSLHEGSLEITLKVSFEYIFQVNLAPNNVNETFNTLKIGLEIQVKTGLPTRNETKMTT